MSDLTYHEGRLGDIEAGAYLFTEMMAAELPEPQWLIDKWLVNEPTIIAGRPKTFKSTFAMEMAVAIASGEPFLGDPEFKVREQQPVVYVMEENSAGATRNLVADIMMAKGLGQITGTDRGDGTIKFQWSGASIPLTLVARAGVKLESDWVDALIEFCHQVDSKIVFLDAWYRLLPLGVDEKYGTGLAPIFDEIQKIAKAGITPILIGHTNKGGTKIQEDSGGVSIMGSTYVEGFFEGFLICYKATNEDLSPVNVRRFWRNKPAEPWLTVTLADLSDRKSGWVTGPYEAAESPKNKKTTKNEWYRAYREGTLDGMSMEQQGELFGVAKSTIHSWRKDAGEA